MTFMRHGRGPQDAAFFDWGDISGAAAAGGARVPHGLESCAATGWFAVFARAARFFLRAAPLLLEGITESCVAARVGCVSANLSRSFSRRRFNFSEETKRNDETASHVDAPC
jgi:hypothetical protein